MDQDVREALFAQLHQAFIGRSRPLIVGISGAYTSGKTVFTDGFDGYLKKQGERTQVIHYDDFHHPFDTIDWTDDNEVDVFYDHAFDPAKLEAEILLPLKARGTLEKDVACVDLGTGLFTNNIHIDIGADTIVLLEGVLLFRPPVDQYLDFRLYLDIATDEMLRRARLRDVPRFGEGILDKFITRYIPVQQRYMAEHRPQMCSDALIDNNDPRAPRLIR